MMTRFDLKVNYAGRKMVCFTNMQNINILKDNLTNVDKKNIFYIHTLKNCCLE